MWGSVGCGGQCYMDVSVMWASVLCGDIGMGDQRYVGLVVC